MPAASDNIETLLVLLAETPRCIASLTEGFRLEQLHSQPDEDAWSVRDIAAHLRANADVWGKSVLAMLSKDSPTLRYVSPRSWMKKSGYMEEDFYESLQAFATQRDDFLKMLRGLAIEDWSRGAIFTGTTRGRNATVFSYVRRIVEHEGPHLDQIESTLSALSALTLQQSEVEHDESGG